MQSGSSATGGGMAGNNHSEDWLPLGWRVEVRVRKFSRNDKQYYARSGQKFFSKLEVLRHLKNNSSASTPHLEEGKDVCVDNWHHPYKENKQVIVDRCAVDTHDNGERSSPTSIEKEKSSPDISTYFSCNSMDSSSTTLVEENHVIEQNVKIHSGDTPNISCRLPKDEKTNADEAALEISGKSAANNLQNMENGIHLQKLTVPIFWKKTPLSRRRWQSALISLLWILP